MDAQRRLWFATQTQSMDTGMGTNVKEQIDLATLVDSIANLRPGERRVEISIPQHISASSAKIVVGGSGTALETRQFEDMAWLASTRMRDEFGPVLGVSRIRLEGKGDGDEGEAESERTRKSLAEGSLQREWNLKAYTARLAFETPHLSLPFEVYEAVIAAVPGGVEYVWFSEATKYEPRLPCGLVTTLPSIVVDLNGGDGKRGQVTVRPEQYAMRIGERATGDGEGAMCALLVERIGGARGSREVGLGWSAFRGRRVVLDWDAGFVGIGR
ncbi:hypothetical protein K491DRAFT_698347 [Lophiostoma macrostomum CBS 122681]|uniref:Peptidase A1 domain-containing protein n=1 Tax=Lophiostoma macrostomum CBS 122681 TaxID=1314788 RepID=A0A6A6SMS9_9PLEO|nr:hypothetical protein K491DRAFT_698347 [Lophiostoma macrostomum CBS 122681]